MTEEKAEHTTGIAILEPRDITAENIELMLAQVKEIPEPPEEKEQYETVKGMHIQVKKILPKIESRRKAIKKGPLMVCKRIDASAKKAVDMVQPLLLATGSRREAWEKIKAEEKAAEMAKEKDRQDYILAGLKKIKELAAACMEYGIESSVIKERIKSLEDHHVSEETYQEFFEEAQRDHGNGLIAAQMDLENRIKFEDDRAKEEAKRKADAKAQAKIEADNKAESARLSKIAEDQKAEAEKLELEKAALEAGRKILADAEKKRLADEDTKKAVEIEAGRIKKRDELWAEALPIHIWEHIYPVALEEHAEHDRKKREAMDTASRRKMDILKSQNQTSIMLADINEAITNAVVSAPKMNDDVSKELILFVNKIQDCIDNFETVLSDIN